MAAMIRDGLAVRWDPRWTAMAEAMRTLRPTVLSAKGLSPGRRGEILRDLATEEAMEALSRGGVTGLTGWLRQRHADLDRGAEWESGRVGDAAHRFVVRASGASNIQPSNHQPRTTRPELQTLTSDLSPECTTSPPDRLVLLSRLRRGLFAVGRAASLAAGSGGKGEWLRAALQGECLRGPPRRRRRARLAFRGPRKLAAAGGQLRRVRLARLLLAGFVAVRPARPRSRGLDWFLLPIVVLLLVAAAVFGRPSRTSTVHDVWSGSTRYGIRRDRRVRGRRRGRAHVLDRQPPAARQAPLPGPKIGSLERLEHVTFSR